MGRKYRLHASGSGSALAVRVTPRASKNEICEILSDGTVRIHLTASPVDGQANQALIKFLAGILSVSPSHLEIIAGQTGRDKLISVVDLNPEIVHQRIRSAIG